MLPGLPLSHTWQAADGMVTTISPRQVGQLHHQIDIMIINAARICQLRPVVDIQHKPHIASAVV